jgi:hypothetical protein
MLSRWRFQVGLALVGCLLATSCGATRQIRRRGFHQQHINHDDDHQAAHDHKPTALRWLPRQVVDRGDAATTHDDRAQHRRRAGYLSIPFR